MQTQCLLVLSLSVGIYNVATADHCMCQSESCLLNGCLYIKESLDLPTADVQRYCRQLTYMIEKDVYCTWL